MYKKRLSNLIIKGSRKERYLEYYIPFFRLMLDETYLSHMYMLAYMYTATTFPTVSRLSDKRGRRLVLSVARV